jgi:hypothetical protein
MRSLFAGAAPAGDAPALADDNVLLIQLQPGGGYKVWHTEGESQLRRGRHGARGDRQQGRRQGDGNRAGPARAFETPDGIVISLPPPARTSSCCSIATAAAMCGCGTVPGPPTCPKTGSPTFS